MVAKDRADTQNNMLSPWGPDIGDTYWQDCPDNLFILQVRDSDFILAGFNPAQAAAAGFSDEDQGKPFSELFTRSLSDRLVANYRQCLAKRRPLIYEETYQQPDGEFTYWETHLSPVFDVSGEVTHICGRGRNITELRQAQNRLAEQTQAARSAQTVKMAFLANMSHEMRTPLNGIKGALELISEVKELTDRNELIALAQQSVGQLNRLTTDILDYAKLNAGSLRLQTADFSPQSLAKDLQALLTPMAARHDVTLSVQADTAMPMALHGDRARIQQILLNLTTNGIKFSPSGSVNVLLAANPCEDRHYSFRILVQDSGIGIAKADQSILFQPFTQLDSSPTREHPGSGLGLAICRELTDLMGGAHHSPKQ